MTDTLPPARPVPPSPSDRTIDELRSESLRLEAASLHLREWAAAVGMRSAVVSRLARPIVIRPRDAVAPTAS